MGDRVSESYRSLSAGTKLQYGGAGGVGWPQSRCDSRSVAIRSSDPMYSQTREMESTGAYRVTARLFGFDCQ